MKVVFFVSCVLADEHKLLHYATGEVVGGSYNYYSLADDCGIKIVLISETGDADLYVSQIITKPTYEPDQYCFQSATCAEDIVVIPNSSKRPINIGVYGHPSYENSKYILVVFQITEIDNDQEQEPLISTSITWYLLDLLFRILF
ncbi:PREDICTED: UPF0669 protein v1g209471-like [Eufriesea mexicana]|uniref:UPF0669 protein v1g209471-like n=1 Tax=Eufriesea mexicana TaxID=516756 RepID=UPI00083BEAA6|nr:PREDICTED: UPF0669 protein v1g209471-like [Eufriesea mexicana]